MKCKRCGNTVLPNQVFCNKCGAPIEDDGKKEKNSLFGDENTEKKGKSKFIILISILVAAIIILLILLLLLNKKDKTSDNNENTASNEPTSFYTIIGDYEVELPANYSQSSNQDNVLKVYNESDEYLGQIKVKETTYAAAVSKANQLIQSENNTTNAGYKSTVMSQEKQKINGLDCTVYKIKVLDQSNSPAKTYFCYVSITKVTDSTSALIITSPNENEKTGQEYLEKLMKIVATVQKK